MADQFCKIVDTTITDSTMGSDATQSIITTDASTSFIIRDLHKTDSCCNTTFCNKFDIKMDGHTVLSNFCNEATGTMIVPPSTTVCVTDTTGNYPLSYKDVTYSIYRFCNDACCSYSWNYCDNGGCNNNCSSAIEEDTQLFVNGVYDQDSGTPCCMTSCCTATCHIVPPNSCICEFGTARTEWNRCWIVYATDGRECTARNIKIVKRSDGSCMMNYSSPNCYRFLHQDGMLVGICANNCVRVWDLRQACTCFCHSAPHIHWCQPSKHCATYCCGSALLSTPQKGCWACRVLTTICAQGTCNIYFNPFNVCTCECCVFLVQGAGNACQGYAVRVAMGASWDEDKNTWWGVTYGRSSTTDACSFDYIMTWRSCDCFCCVLCTATRDNAFKYSSLCYFNDKAYFRPTNSTVFNNSSTLCKDLYEWDLRGYALETCSTCEPQLVRCNFFCNWYNCCAGTYCVSQETPSSATISGRTYNIDPSSKLTIYGIKST